MLLGEKVFPYNKVREATRYLGSVFRTYIGSVEFILRDGFAPLVRVDNIDHELQQRVETDTYVAVLGNRKYTIASNFDRVVFSVREEEYELPKRKRLVLLLC